jgi:protein O-mannosyl-transferase
MAGVTKRRRTQPVSKTSRSRSFFPMAAICLALLLVNIGIYEPVRAHDFVNWDDDLYVTANSNVLKGWSWNGLLWAFTTQQAANWHPVTWLSHMTDVKIFGPAPGPHHLVSVALHIVNSILLFVILFEMTGAVGPSAFVAGLFAAHPLHVESVAWISERKDVLSTLFWMLTLWAYTAFVRERRTIRYVALIAFFALGLMTKPMLVTLPFVLLLLDIWPLRRVRLERGQAQVWLQLFHEKVPLFVLALASSIVTIIVQRESGAVAGLEIIPISLRVNNATLSYVSYIFKMLWPAGLSTFYPYLLSFPVWWAFAAIVGLAGITVMVLYQAPQRPYLLVGWLWYLGTLLPVIGLIQVGGQRMADRYTYIPLIGLFMIVAWGIPDLLRITSLRMTTPVTSVVTVAAACVVLVCAMTARAQVRYWKTGETLWKHALTVNNNDARAHNNLGLALAAQGKRVEAITHYREAIRIDPESAEYHFDLGNALREQGRLSDAVTAYTAAVRINPNEPSFHIGLGAALTQQRRTSEAIAQFSEALRLNSGSADVHNDMGIALGLEGKTQEALLEFQEALRIDSENPRIHYNFAIALEGEGQTAEAVRQFKIALQLDPQYNEARRRLDRLTGR